MPNWSRRPSGTLTAVAPPISLADGGRLGTATLTWTTRDADSVEIRVDAADGKLFHRGRAQGSATTGPWVRDGTTFYLQDPGSPGGPGEGTLATATVRLQALWQDLEIHAAVAAVARQRLGMNAAEVQLMPSHPQALVCRISGEHRAAYLKAFLDPARDTTVLEAWAYGRLHDRGVPAPEVLELDAGGAVFPLGYLLLSEVAGRPMSEVDELPTEARSALLREAGGYLRRVHDAELGGFGRIDGPAFVRDGIARGSVATWHDALRRRLDGLLSRLVASGRVDTATVAAIRATFARHASAAGDYEGSARMIHGDFDTGQVFVDPTLPAVTGIFDFDDVAAGDPCWDLATVGQRDGGDTLGALLEGYQPDAALRNRLARVRPLYDLLEHAMRATVALERGRAAEAGSALARLSVMAR